MEALSRWALTPRAKGRVCASWYSTSVSWLRRLRAASRDFSLRSSVLDLRAWAAFTGGAPGRERVGWDKHVGCCHMGLGFREGGQSRDCAGLAVWPGRVAGALWAWVDYTAESLLASGFICPRASPCRPPVLHSSPRRAQGRSVPSLTYLLFILRAWEAWRTGRPPAGRGLAELARSQGREGARRCLQPPRPPALQPPRTPSSALSPPQLS